MNIFKKKQKTNDFMIAAKVMKLVNDLKQLGLVATEGYRVMMYKALLDGVNKRDIPAYFKNFYLYVRLAHKLEPGTVTFVDMETKEILGFYGNGKASIDDDYLAYRKKHRIS